MESETSGRFGPTSEATTDGAPASKRFRCQEPDVTVIVGEGDDEEHFECYSIILCCASDLFDTMLSTQMKEKNSREIRLPDKNPREWELFYANFIHPSPMANPELRVGGDVLNDKGKVETMLPWFHYFGMDKWLSKCDRILSTDLAGNIQIGKNPKLSRKELKEESKLFFRGLHWADRYGLPLTEAISCKYLKIVLKRIPREVVDEDFIKALKPYVHLDGFKEHIWTYIQALLPVKMQDEDPGILFEKELFSSLLMARIELEQFEDVISYVPDDLYNDIHCLRYSNKYHRIRDSVLVLSPEGNE